MGMRLVKRRMAGDMPRACRHRPFDFNATSINAPLLWHDEQGLLHQMYFRGEEASMCIRGGFLSTAQGSDRWCELQKRQIIPLA